LNGFWESRGAVLGDASSCSDRLYARPLIRTAPRSPEFDRNPQSLTTVFL
jgi:hypothetical protein